eukprot:s2336_g2.t3
MRDLAYHHLFRPPSRFCREITWIASMVVLSCRAQLLFWLAGHRRAMRCRRGEHGRLRIPAGLVLMMLWLWTALTPLASAGFMRSHHMLKVEFHQELRVCNAFASEAAFDVVKGSDTLTGSEPLKYMQCQSFTKEFKAGDNLEFKQGNKTAGVFTVEGLPQHDAILMLLVHKSQDPGQSVSFMSHVFAPSETAQIAVIDTYNGAPVNMSITEGGASEALVFGTVTGINPGAYDIVLDSKAHPSRHFEAKKEECYIVVRTGWSCQGENCSYPQQILVYPQDRRVVHAPPWLASLSLFSRCSLVSGERLHALLSQKGASSSSTRKPEIFIDLARGLVAGQRCPAHSQGSSLGRIMFGWLTGATTSVECTGDYDSTIQPGKKGIITDPIEDMTPEKFHTGRDVSGNKESGMVVAFHVEVSGIAALLVSFKASIYNKYYQKDGCYYIENYAADKELKKLGHQTVLKPLTDPFRLEIFDVETGARRAGPFLKGALENELKSAEIAFEKAEAEQPSPTTPGEFSILVSGIQDISSTEALWEKTKTFMLAKGATEEADGSLKMENAGWFGASTFSLSTYNKEKDEIVALDCGQDATCKEFNGTAHTKVLKDSAQIERWVFPKAAVTSDDKGAKALSQVASAIVNMD